MNVFDCQLMTLTNCIILSLYNMMSSIHTMFVNNLYRGTSNQTYIFHSFESLMICFYFVLILLYEPTLIRSQLQGVSLEKHSATKKALAKCKNSNKFWSKKTSLVFVNHNTLLIGNFCHFAETWILFVIDDIFEKQIYLSYRQTLINIYKKNFILSSFGIH